MQLDDTIETFITTFGPDSFSSSGNSSSYHGYNSSSHGYNTMSGASIVTSSTGPEGSDPHGNSESDAASSGYLNDYTDFETGVGGGGGGGDAQDDASTVTSGGSKKSTHHKRSSSKQQFHHNLNSDHPKKEHRWRHNRKRGTEKCVSGSRSSVRKSLSYSRLPSVERVPWSDHDVLNSIREGRVASTVNQRRLTDGQQVLQVLTPPNDVTQRLGQMLQNPMVRIAREAQRFSATFRRCGRYEVHSALKVVLSSACYKDAIHAGHKASTLYAMSADSFKVSKSSRSGLQMSVGRFQRWLTDAGVAPFVHEVAAIYAAAAIESLLDDLVLCLYKSNSDETSWTVNELECTVGESTDLWGIIQPWEHLRAGRNAAGYPCLPSNYRPVSDVTTTSVHSSPRATRGRDVEKALLQTSIGSLEELGEQVQLCMSDWYSRYCCMLPVSSASVSTTTNHAPPSPPTGTPTGAPPTGPPTWSREALQALYYYMRSEDMEQMNNPNLMLASLQINRKRSNYELPPLHEWLRVSSAHAEHRKDAIVIRDDVMQAARVLLPGADCPTYRSVRCSDSTHYGIEGKPNTSRGKTTTTHNLNYIDEKGFTSLMYACYNGDDSTVHDLVDAGATVNMAVPTDSHVYPALQPDIKHWTALTFAVSQGHYSIAKYLLDHGANCEGSVEAGEENYTETPLQLAAAAGDYELVSLLLMRGADPYLNTIHKNGISYTYSRGSYSAFALAASHGHSLSTKNVLRKLLSNPIKKNCDVISLEEMLAEGALSNNALVTSSSTSSATSSSSTNKSALKEDSYGSKLYAYAEQLRRYHLDRESDLEHDYATIEDVIFEDHKLRATSWPDNTLESLTKAQFRCLQEAMYHAAENGYLDVTLELRNLGVPWTIHTWSQSLSSAVAMRRRTITQCLLKDWTSVANKTDVPTQEFIYTTLPVMFDLFKKNKDETTTKLLCNVFCNLYGTDPIPDIEDVPSPPPVNIDPSYVNSAEMSDVQFVVSGRRFFAHKIILAQASPRLKSLVDHHSYQDEAGHTCIELNDISYETLGHVMQYLYNGGHLDIYIDQGDVMQLLSAASFFQLEGLQRFCEKICAERLTMENCVNIYRNAKLNDCTALMAYCEAYFLGRLPGLIVDSVQFVQLAFHHDYDGFQLVQNMMVTLTQHLLNKRKQAKHKREMKFKESSSRMSNLAKQRAQRSFTPSFDKAPSPPLPPLPPLRKPLQVTASQPVSDNQVSSTCDDGSTDAQGAGHQRQLSQQLSVQEPPQHHHLKPQHHVAANQPQRPHSALGHGHSGSGATHVSNSDHTNNHTSSHTQHFNIMNHILPPMSSLAQPRTDYNIDLNQGVNHRRHPHRTTERVYQDVVLAPADSSIANPNVISRDYNSFALVGVRSPAIRLSEETADDHRTHRNSFERSMVAMSSQV